MVLVGVVLVVLVKEGRGELWVLSGRCLWYRLRKVEESCGSCWGGVGGMG